MAKKGETRAESPPQGITTKSREGRFHILAKENDLLEIPANSFSGLELKPILVIKMRASNNLI